jgi:hypothetical protein
MKTTSKTLLCTVIAAMAISFTSAALADQPHMDAALSHLEAAKAELEQAESNKGGWRVAALAAVENAIREIHNGKRFAR